MFIKRMTTVVYILTLFFAMSVTAFANENEDMVTENDGYFDTAEYSDTENTNEVIETTVDGEIQDDSELADYGDGALEPDAGQLNIDAVTYGGSDNPKTGVATGIIALIIMSACTAFISRKRKN